MNRISLPYLAAVRVSGRDAGDFLHAQLSADIQALGDGKGGFACFCSPRGQVFGLLLVCREAGSFLLAGSAELLPTIVQRLQLYVLRDDVVFSVDEGLGCQGIEAPSVAVGKVFEADDLGLHYGFAAAASPEPADAERWKSRELEAGIVWLSAQTSEKFIPQMLGFESIGAVSFSKGCFPGQEVIARARYLGKVKRRPLRVLLEGSAEPEPGSRVELRHGENWRAAQVVDSAIHDPEGRLLFLVSSLAPDESPDSLRIGKTIYRCATM